MMPRHPRPGETREEYSAYLEEFKANPPTLPRPSRRRGGWSSGMVPWRNPPEGMSPLSDTLGLGNLTDKLQDLAKEGGVPRNEPGPDGGFFTGPLTKYIEPTPTDDLIPYPEDAGPDFPSREDIVARNESYEHWREADNQRRQGIMAANYFLGDMAPSELLRSYKERVNTPDAPVSMAYGGMPSASTFANSLLGRAEQQRNLQDMLGRSPQHPALNTGNRQPPQGWPGQQPGFNLQEATGALDTAQGLGPQGIAPPMLPAFMANGGPAETTGIGPLYMQGGGLMDHIDSLSAEDVARGVSGLGLSLADLAGGFGKLGGLSTGIGALTGLISAYRSGDIRDVLPFKIGHLIGRMFGYDPEGDRAKTEGPSWDKSTTLTGPRVTRGPVAPALYPTPGTRPFDPKENPFDPDASAGDDDYSYGPGGGFSWEGYGAEGGESWDI